MRKQNKQIISLILAIIMRVSCSVALIGCGNKTSAKEKYGLNYYVRPDGTKKWYYTN